MSPIPELRDRVISGAGWSLLAGGGVQLLQFVFTVALARILAPGDFGLMAMLTVFVAFTGVFRELNLSMAVIQRDEIEERHLSSIFWTDVALGLVWTVVGIVAAAWISTLFNRQDLTPLVRSMAVGFLLGSSCSVHHALLVRQMRFRSLVVVRLVAVVTSGVLAVCLALAGNGVWSLVGQHLAQAAVSMILLWRLAGWRPTLCFEGGALKDVLAYSGGVTGFRLVNFFLRNLDDLVIGRYLGSSPLGIYSRAYATMLLPLGHVTGPLGSVMFPALASIQHDLDRFKRGYLEALRVIAFIAFPLMLGLLVVAEPFVLAIYGEQWRGVVPMLRLFCLLGMVQSISSTIGWIYLSLGRSGLQFLYALVACVPIVTGILLGVRQGSVLAVAVGYSAAAIVTEIPPLFIGGWLVGFRVREVVGLVGGSAIAAALMAGLVFICGSLLPAGCPALLRLAILVPLGVVSYWTAASRLRLVALHEVIGILRDRLRGRQADSVDPVEAAGQ